MLPCCSLTRLALTGSETLMKVLSNFLIVCTETGLFRNGPQRWECLARGVRLRCFVEWVPPLIRASQRLSNHGALWLVEPHPDLSCEVAAPGREVLAKGKGKGCAIQPTLYHGSLEDEEKARISMVIIEETGRHYSTRRE